jgi:alkanesulfonate monooxygenase SsuD/methylene tetrahydromethanopterin reductase-like flavin-dependent oxidoreductase (luciferase family)
MRNGMFGGSINTGTIDDVVAEARQAEADGFASYWAPNIFGHDALTTLAIVGREVPRIELGTSVVPTCPRHREGAAGPEDIAITGSASEVVDRIRALADIGVTDFAAVEFPGNPHEADATREAIKKAMA